MDANEHEVKNRRYTLIVDDQPTKVLEPVWGYASEPLLSLRDACKPLHRIVSRLEPHIWVALENSKNPSDNLTQDESAAIYLYTMEWEPLSGEPEGSLYKHLNQTLRKINRSELRPWFRYLKLFITALAKIQISHRQIIWRGIRKDQSSDYAPGTEVTWWSFTSCTQSLSVLETDLYLGKTGTRTLFSIEALNGRTILSHSHFKTEDEILLLPGTRLEVLSRLNPAPDLYIIHLRQIHPPHELLEPPFDGACLLPPSTDFDAIMEFGGDKKRDTRLWYKKKRVWFISSIAILLIILAIILGTTLGTRKSNNETPITIVNTSNINSDVRFMESDNTTVVWSDDKWNARNERNSQPGSYNWMASNVVLDSNNQGLYMRLNRDTLGNWWCAQVESQNLYTFGNFTFWINATVDRFDPNVELRMFTKNGDDETNGISIDIGRRGQTMVDAHDLWYTIYPNSINGSISNSSSRIPLLTGTYTTYRFNWMTNIVTMEAEYDNNREPNPPFRFNNYSTDTSWAKFIPQTPARVVISLCTYNGGAPANNQEVEVNTRLFLWKKN